MGGGVRIRPNQLLSYIMSSGVRKGILYRLSKEPMVLTRLKESLDLTSPEIIPRIKELEKRNLLYKEGGVYHLTSTGMIVSEKLLQVDHLSSLLDERGQFFNSHDLGAIPENLRYRIEELGNSKLIENKMENINATYWEVLDCMSRSTSILGIMPVFDPYHPQFFSAIVKKNVPVSLIFTSNIFNLLKNKYVDIFHEYLKYDNVKLYVVDDARLSLIASDNFLSVSLYRKNGRFDAMTNLMSFDGTALKWGEELFEYYRKRSDEIKNTI
jgi:predicted transcriptional regulator